MSPEGGVDTGKVAVFCAPIKKALLLPRTFCRFLGANENGVVAGGGGWALIDEMNSEKTMSESLMAAARFPLVRWTSTQV